MRERGFDQPPIHASPVTDKLRTAGEPSASPIPPLEPRIRGVFNSLAKSKAAQAVAALVVGAGTTLGIVSPAISGASGEKPQRDQNPGHTLYLNTPAAAMPEGITLSTPTGPATAKIERQAASLPVPSVLEKLYVENPTAKVIRDIKDRVDSSGNVIERLALHENGYVYRSEKGADGRQGAYLRVNVSQKLELGNSEALPARPASTLVVSPDGQHMAVLGEDPKNPYTRIIYLSNNRGKTFRKLSFTGPGIYTEAVLLPDGQALLLWRKNIQNNTNMDTLNLQTGAVVPVAGAGYSYSALSPVSSEGNIQRVFAVGMQSGINDIRFDSTRTAQQVSLTQYLTEYGKLEGGFFVEKDTNGSPKTLYATHLDNKEIYVFDLTRNQLISTINIYDLDTALRRKNLPNYAELGSIRSIYKTGNRIWMTGGAWSQTDNYGRAIAFSYIEGADLTDPNNITAYSFEPNTHASALSEKDMRPAIFNGQRGMSINIYPKGDVFIPTDQGYNPIGTDFYWIDRGIGAINRVDLPAIPSITTFRQAA